MRSLKSVVIPNALIENLGGTLEGKCRGSTMLQEIGLLNDLRREAWFNAELCCLYGKAKLIRWDYTFNPIQKQTIAVTSQKLLYSKAMSEVQVAVKWLFGNLGNYCKFVDFKNLFLNFVLCLLFINTLPT